MHYRNRCYIPAESCVDILDDQSNKTLLTELSGINKYGKIINVRDWMKESIYTTGKKREISGKQNGNTRIWQFDLSEMVLKQPQTNNVT